MRVPEIADDIVNVDRAMCWGFGWKLGPFQTWDAIGLRRSVERMQAEGRDVPAWILELLAAGKESFYARSDDGESRYLAKDATSHAVQQPAGVIMLSDVKASKGVVDTNASASLIDLGDGVLGLEFHCKMNAIDDLLGAMYDRGLNLLDENAFTSMVVGNQDARAFCAGANLAMILMWASQGEFDEIGGLIDRLHANTQRAKHSKRPIVTAPFGLTLGGGVELSLASSATLAGSELYMGLVEAGVGLIPAGGGCKEMMFRTLGGIRQDIDYDPNPFVQKVFETIAMAKVSTSAHDAKAWGYLRPTDRIVLNPDRLVAEANATAMGLVTAGYEPPAEVTIKLPGRSGRAAIEAHLHQMHDAGYATEHDLVVGTHLANILTGGDIPSGTAVTERHLLDLEREAFLSLCGEEKTRLRMLHMLQTNKPLRN
jgi:3-hydroxyacyl-CoA dehydrogenase